ncbi:hypothetical protein ACL02S_08315 [Nocardia sp. 004]|uniref:hypothetical protein n=1 Tax=Nocardia sp. 004 TaxID=3385978 RepID=UPI00399FB677
MTTELDDHVSGKSGTAQHRFGPVLNAVIAGVLVLNALLTLSLEVLYLPTYLGAIAFPVSAPVAGAVNVLLVAGMRSLSSCTAAMGLPVVAWALGFLVCVSTGPGGDLLLSPAWPTVLLLFCGIVPPLVYIYFQVNAHLFSRG